MSSHKAVTVCELCILPTYLYICIPTKDMNTQETKLDSDGHCCQQLPGVNDEYLFVRNFQLVVPIQFVGLQMISTQIQVIQMHDILTGSRNWYNWETNPGRRVISKSPACSSD